eukprot:12402252-Karenia_brevis.AAC.1
MEKLYDNISIPTLIKEATGLGYPPLILKLGLQMHMACKSTTFAKILFHAIIQEAYDQEVIEALARGLLTQYATNLRTFVDDISSIRGHEAW